MSHITISLPAAGLIFEDGDAVIRAGEHRTGLFVIHAELLAKHSSWFMTMFSTNWNQSRLVDVRGTCRKDSAIDETQRERPSHDVALFKTWPDCSSDSDYLNLLGHRWTLDMVQGIPRLQFPFSSVQPKMSHGVSEYGDLLRSRLYTYARYLAPYCQIIPPLSSDICQLDWCSRAHGRWAPSAQRAQYYVKLMWRSFLSLLYGQPLGFAHGFQPSKRVRLAANLIVLANYFGAVEAVRPGLELFVLQHPGIWKFIAENARFTVMLGYYLKSTPIYIDATKHLVGSLLSVSSFGYEDHLKSIERAMGCDLDETELPTCPPSVVSFLTEALACMQMTATSCQQGIIDILATQAFSFSNPGYSPRTLDTVRRLTPLYMAAWLGTAPSYHNRVNIQPALSTPARRRLLWQCKRARDVTPLIKPLKFDQLAEEFDVPVEDVAAQALFLLSRITISSVLEGLCSPGTPSTCPNCIANKATNATYATAPYRHRILDLASQTICDQHAHGAMYDTGNMFTTLHTWSAGNDITGDDESESKSNSWPPAAWDYYPNQPTLQPLPQLTPQIASLETLALLGLDAPFMLNLNEAQMEKHMARKIAKTLDLFDDEDGFDGGILDVFESIT